VASVCGRRAVTFLGGGRHDLDERKDPVMLGRKDYTKAEYDNGRAAIAQQLSAYKKIAKLAGGANADKKTSAALDEFEHVYFNNMAIVLDRLFVHRIRAVAGKDGNPLNEVELICDSLMNNGAVFQGNTVFKYIAGESVLGLAPGDKIQLTAPDFQRLSTAFFEELHRKFL
jgi:hypothetical protein